MSIDEIKEWFPTLEFLDFCSQASNQREAVEKGVSIEALYQEKTGKSHLLEDVKNVEEVRNSVQQLIANTKLPIELQDIYGDNIGRIASLEMKDNYLIVSTVTSPIPQLEEISIPANFSSKLANGVDPTCTEYADGRD